MIRARTPAVVVILVALAAGCGSGGPPAPTPTPPGTPAPTPVVDPVAGVPPPVSLAAAGGPSVAGDLGTFDWNGLVSDSPWILGRAAVAVPSRGILAAVVAGNPPVGAWTARWARVVNGNTRETGDGAASGTGLPITVRAPAPGAWSLCIEVVHGNAGRAAWYWRVDVAP